MTARTADRPRTTTRLLGVDAARGLALLGMMATHLIPEFGPDGGVTVTYVVADGRASALFAVVAGMSLALADGGAGPASSRRPFQVLALRTLVRAALIAVIGLLLAITSPPVLIILAYYAVLFLLLLPFLRLPPAVLAAAALLWAVAGPIASHAIRGAYQLPVVFDQPSFALLIGDPAALLRQLLLTGTYPAGTWLAYALAGAALGRAVLTPVRAIWVAVGGLVLAVTAAVASSSLVAAGMSALLRDPQGTDPNGRFYGTTPVSSWWWLAVDRPHSGTPLDLLGTIGTSTLVIAVAVLVFSTPARRWLTWLADTGSMTLTLYTVHVLAAAAGLPTDLAARDRWLVHVVVAVAVAVLWRRAFRRGPLEAVVAQAADLVGGGRRRQPRSATS